MRCILYSMGEDQATMQSKSRRGPLIALFLLALLLLLILIGIVIWSQSISGGTGPTAAPTQPDKAIRVRAYIDGRSRLRLQGNTVQWLHLEWAAPGKHGGLNKPTVINGKEWFPEWPD